MNKFFSFVVNRHQEIIRYFMIGVAMVVIAYFLPKIGLFKYDYEVGKPWRYENLIAPYSFGILKSDKELGVEKQKLLSEFTPYYKVDSSVGPQKIDEFIQRFNRQMIVTRQASFNTVQPDSAKLITVGISILSNLYEKGIVQLNEEHRNWAPNSQVSVLRKDNIAEVRRVSDLRMLKDAYTYVRQTLSRMPRSSANILQPLIEESVGYNIFFDDATTKKFKSQLLENMSRTRGLVQEGEMIITKGSIITEEKFQILKSFEKEYDRRIVGIKKGQLIFMGNLLLTFIVIVIFTAFIQTFSPEVFDSNLKILFVFLIITLMVILTSSLVKTDLPILYAIPFCIVPIILRTFFGATLALHAHITLVLLISFIVPYGLGYAFLQFIAGMVAIFTNVKAFYWSQFFTANALILVTYLAGYFAVAVVQEGALENINTNNFGWLTLNVLLLFLSYPLIPLFEKTFGFVSEITLIELSDINKPLLKDLAIKAPGTFQHSLQVANLAEAAAYEIGANTLLVKVGALYHDIGKMENPLYFIENQKSEINPHDELPYNESAHLIIGHVKKGIDLAKKNNLPDILIDFIRTHHGTTRVEYFYRALMKNLPEEMIDDKIFRYPGPLPYSKETAILMMADSVEAASRSIKNPSDKDIDSLVEKLINSKIEQNQFVNSNITFKDINIIKKVLKKMLYSIYHVRIAYPEEQK